MLARARMLLGLAPFALALFAAGLQARVSPAALLLGCALGALRFPLTEVDPVSYTHLCHGVHSFVFRQSATARCVRANTSSIVPEPSTTQMRSGSLARREA